MSRFPASQSAAELRTALPSVHVAAQGGRAIKTMSHGTQVWQPHGPVCVFHDLLFPTLWQEVSTLPASRPLYALNASKVNLPFFFLLPLYLSSLPASPPLPPPPAQSFPHSCFADIIAHGYVFLIWLTFFMSIYIFA